jgi:transcriptional regulator with XRE-family HTH domain
MQRRRKRENIDLAALIRSRRLNVKRWTQTDLARVLGVTKAAVSGWENAHFRPANIRLVSRVLGISLDDLVR